MNKKIISSRIHNISVTRFVRYTIMLVLTGIGLFILFRQVDNLKVNDFARYWLSSRLLLSGGDPYTAPASLPVQDSSAMSLDQSCITYNPPWSLPLLLVFGVFSRPVGQMLWLLIQITVVLLCAIYIWRLYGGQTRYKLLPWLLAFTFGPVIAAIVLQGQISPLILLGMIGFLLFIDQPKKSWLAGIFLVLTSLKPQVLYLFFIAFILWIIFSQKWSPLIGFASIIIILSIIIYLIDPKVYTQYFQCMLEKGPGAWATPTIGTYLRLAFDTTGFQLQFLPSLLGAIWLVIYWLKRRQVWDWKVEMPLILFITTITSAYIWTYDLVLLLLPLLLAFIWLIGENRRWISVILVISYLAIDALYLWLHLRLDDSYFIWFAPALFVWYLVTQAVHNSTTRHLAVNKSV